MPRYVVQCSRRVDRLVVPHGRDGEEEAKLARGDVLGDVCIVNKYYLHTFSLSPCFQKTRVDLKHLGNLNFLGNQFWDLLVRH